MKRIFAGLSALLLVTVLVSCGGSGKKKGTPAPLSTPMQVHVINKNWLQVVVSFVSSGSAQRLGSVETAQEHTFVLPRTISPTPLRFRVDPIGSPEIYVSPEVMPESGLVVELTVENDLRHSTITW